MKLGRGEVMKIFEVQSPRFRERDELSVKPGL
jgi:hypothetical protein